MISNSEGFIAEDDDEITDVEKYAQPRQVINSPEPSAGYMIPRPVPQR